LDEKLKSLLELQAIDIRFDEIVKEKEQAPKEIKKLKIELDLLKGSMDKDLRTIEELKKERRAVERELEEVELKIKKSRSKLDEVRSNKEYQAVLKEIEDLKELNSNKEEIVIKWMEDIEIQEKECGKTDIRWKESQQVYDKQNEQCSKRMKELDKETESLVEERTKLSQKVDKDLLKGYEGLRNNLKGMVVVSAIDAVCQGCHLGIPPQQYNNLIKGESLQNCPHCNRIIYCNEIIHNLPDK
jgi:predicted  nucleic acid-binding Zn-ribbon protein